MDFTRQCKRGAEFVAAPALLSASLRELFQKLHLYAENLCRPGWQFVGISSTSKSLSESDISRGFAASPSTGAVVCLSLLLKFSILQTKHFCKIPPLSAN